MIFLKLVAIAFFVVGFAVVATWLGDELDSYGD